MRLRSLLLLLVLLAAFACGKREETVAVEQAAPVFIISIDTLRSDHLPAYGFRGGSTPAIDRFRGEAVLFQRAFSHCPQTLPSHTSLFTGLLPAEHGVRDNIGYVLREDVPMLQELLKEHGYATGAAVSTHVLRRSTGIARGFDFYDDETDAAAANAATSAERNGDRTREALEHWLDQASGDRVFGFLHLYEPHSPYRPPSKYASLPSRYDGEIAYADAIVGRFLDYLHKRGWYDRALIVVMSDHGEGLGDHGEDEHGILLYREAIQVPLLIKLPGGDRRGAAVAEPVGLTDVAPTILARLGMQPPAAMKGANALSLPTGAQRQIFSETYFPRLHFGWHELTSLADTRFHLIAGRGRELYDYVADPRETRDVSEQNRRVLAAMSAALQSIDMKFAGPSAVDPEDQRKLAALGYVGSTVGTGADLPDPRSRIHIVRLFRDAASAFEAGQDAKTLAAVDAIIRDNPNMVDAWALRARTYRRRGENAKALEALKSAMQRFPNDPSVALALADLMFRMGDYDGAKQHAQLAVQGNATLAHETLARMALQRGNTDEAAQEAALALKESPSRTATLRLLADIRKRQEHWDDQLSLLDRAAAEIEARHLPPVEDLHFDRGEALLHLQRGPESEEAFATETRLFPRNLKAWGSLALVRAAKGDPAAAKATLQDMLRQNPGAAATKVAAETFEAMGDRASAAEMRRAAR
ncbi:MAG TPA: sulfatase-like hydrolase/transferase [Thermoanaerobaculia bacterium]|nr:sulfatase-like hydrolase/transferase [Thermoanaerobaculia bacterium]